MLLATPLQLDEPGLLLLRLPVMISACCLTVDIVPTL